ncbi:hypothetical protein OPS25_04180 [Alteromonas ponticola]|uniref:DNA polymerase III subunit psi n=1 Tax=Alteromonas aquimaris TaxID=2998417 RepID=A0ABT3P5B3_9ALTE|nr:hypothetical protein [Alteromonas aquimaris]MCW8107700.1 hypothetical protein [Alteromonas aquimaris]
MSSSLSTLQIATLQEMGITVWLQQPSSDDNQQGFNHSVAKTSHTNADTTLTHLRSIVSSTSDAKQNEQPLPAAAAKDSSLWIHDVEQVLSELSGSTQQIKWSLGDELRVTTTSVCLPALPLTLSPKLKRQLWGHIAQLSSDR